jgi:type 1 glutamine amidotransferase
LTSTASLPLALVSQAPNAKPIQVLLVTKGHGFDRAPFFELFDELGTEIVYTHVEQPSAQLFWDPENAAAYDVFVYYDAMGRGQGVAGPDGTVTFEEPSAEAKRDLEALLKQGKGMVFLHHSIAAWNQSWPVYAEIVGGACDWSNRVRVRGQEFPHSGAQAGITQRISIVDKSHPITQGLTDGFEIVDETYLCPYFEENLHPLLRTDFVPIPENFPGRYNRTPEQLAVSNFRNHPRGSNLVGWVKSAENSPIVYLQNGHNAQAWENDSYRRLLLNAIKWAASPEAKAWAAANPQKIF